MKKLIITAITAFFLMSAAAVSAEPIELKFACFEPPFADPVKYGYKPFIEAVNKDSEGTLHITLYPGGTLGRDPRLQLKLVMDKVVDFASVVGEYTPGRFPDDEVFKVPFMANDQLEASLAAQRMLDKGLLRGYDDVKIIGLRTTANYHFNTTFPVEKPEDLKGHKIRLTSKLHVYIANQLGISVVGGIPITKVAESISRKVLDGSLNDYTGDFAFRIKDAAKNQTMLPLGCVTLMLAMNQQKYESLPPKAKAAIDKHSGEAFVRKVSEAQLEGNKKMLGMLLKDPKRKVLIPKGDDLKLWKAAIMPAVEKWKKETPNGEKLIKAYQHEIDLIRAGK